MTVTLVSRNRPEAVDLAEEFPSPVEKRLKSALVRELLNRQAYHSVPQRTTARRAEARENIGITPRLLWSHDKS
ncbi:hypothetical protein ElyMa_000915600 [Elysia marginata]|uniref:Uncharacterized protein n=1 Tax=Elysia marginata TaxID=1093978 RepID=A0AAV4HC48_9GAST|nr:hypothetical protein ElyMa_000915600 [Elysia marginata]